MLIAVALSAAANRNRDLQSDFFLLAGTKGDHEHGHTATLINVEIAAVKTGEMYAPADVPGQSAVLNNNDYFADAFPPLHPLRHRPQFMIFLHRQAELAVSSFLVGAENISHESPTEAAN